MSQSCPISSVRIDSNVVRVISFQVVVCSLLLLWTNEYFFALLLLFDFLMRAFRISYLSPFYLIANFFLSSFKIKAKYCDESPKRFALYLGLAISFILVLLVIFGFSTTSVFIVTLLITCALLETLFDFCIGCKIYYALQILNPWKIND
ncbi:MAG: DUF4395 domain-containing protein [Sulfurovum sp.]|nr:DUF4395 domain-containing protein [Sulfurovum sp.]